MNYAGCCNYRDEVDKRIISDTRKGTATFTGEGNKPGFINSPEDIGDSLWPELSIAGLSAPVDSDGDGIPDEWEIKTDLIRIIPQMEIQNERSEWTIYES